MTRLTTKVRYGLANLLRKSASLAFVSEWVKHSWLEPSFQRLTTDGYLSNAAVFQCVSALTFGYNEPPPVVRNPDGDILKDHALQKLLNRPNPMMSHAELMTYIIVYKAIGGQCYLHKVRSKMGNVVELWPYHAGQVSPVPSQYDWVAEYEFDPGNGDKKKVPTSEVIHLKWPSVDLAQPWLALPPLRAVAREVDSDSEMTRYLYALLKNDATPRTLLNVKTSLSDIQFERLRQQFSFRHGGDNRGGVGVVEGDATVTRMSLNLQELAFEALRRVPEARIAGAFRVPAILAGLYVGLEKSTYANYREARSQLIEDTFVPLWTADGNELTQSLSDEFSGNTTIEYDLSRVAALQENEDAKYTRVLNAYDKQVVTKNEARVYLGLPRVGELKILDEGDTFKSEPAQQPQPTILDVTPQPPQLTDESKAREKALEILSKPWLTQAERIDEARKTLGLPPIDWTSDPVSIKARRTEPIEKRLERELTTLYSETWQKVGEGL